MVAPRGEAVNVHLIAGYDIRRRRAQYGACGKYARKQHKRRFFGKSKQLYRHPVKHKHRQKAGPPPVAWKTPELPNEDLEALRSLSDLVTGKAEFDLTYTDEYVEGQTRGLPPTLMEQLRAGRIPYQDHLDLHGYTILQAEAAVTRFILDSVALGRSSVLLIHGRGLGSKDGIPVLKRFLEDFLLRGPARKFILAFTTARPVDGGLGASYILLRG